MNRHLLTVVFLATSLLRSLSFGTPVSDISLINQNGKNFQLADLKGHYVLISFIFTRCPMPEMCPLTMRLSQQLLREWKNQAETLPKLKVVAITLDPDFDTPERLKKYGQLHSVDFSNFILATGDPKQLSQFSSSFNVVGIPSGVSLAHNVKSILFSPSLSEMAQFKDNSWKPEDVIKLVLKKAL